MMRQPGEGEGAAAQSGLGGGRALIRTRQKLPMPRYLGKYNVLSRAQALQVCNERVTENGRNATTFTCQVELSRDSITLRQEGGSHGLKAHNGMSLSGKTGAQRGQATLGRATA